MNNHPPVGPDWIRGITIRQPWTTCILTGDKTIENRPRHWSWRGWLLLHSSQSVDTPALRNPLVARTIRDRHLHTGAILGVARLSACHQDPDKAPPCDLWARPGSHHLVLTDIHELALPIPATGALGPWKPAEHLVDQVLLQLPHVRPPALARQQPLPPGRPVLCRRPTPLRSHAGEAAHKSCTEFRNAAHPGEDRFVSDAKSKRKSYDDHA